MYLEKKCIKKVHSYFGKGYVKKSWKNNCISWENLVCILKDEKLIGKTQHC